MFDNVCITSEKNRGIRNDGLYSTRSYNYLMFVLITNFPSKFEYCACKHRNRYWANERD